jgi:hypothetical protein
MALCTVSVFPPSGGVAALAEVALHGILHVRQAGGADVVGQDEGLEPI